MLAVMLFTLNGFSQDGKKCNSKAKERVHDENI